MIVVPDPSIMGGEPTIRGTRIPVQTILIHVRAGYSREEIFRHYPSLPLDAIEVAMAWADKEIGPDWLTAKAA